MPFFRIHGRAPAQLRRICLLPLVAAALTLGACGSDSTTEETPGSAGQSGAAGKATGTAGKGGSAGSSGSSGQSGASGQAGAAGSTAGAAGAAGTAGKGGGGGASGGGGSAGAAGSAGSAGGAGTAGGGGSAGSAGEGGAAGTAGAAGAAGEAGSAGSAGSGAGCEGDPKVGLECATGLQGACGVGHNKCIQGVVSCVPDVGPGEKSEECNGVDDDCDGQVDEGLPTQSYYLDGDGDGFGTTAKVDACAKPDGYSDKSNDCNDNNKAIFPGAAELCNDVDDNCDGAVDEGAQKTSYYVDDDGDGFGTTATVEACALGVGLSDKSTDCNDNNKAIFPGAEELCNDVDDNCDGVVDEGVKKTSYYVDDDGDGYGTTATVEACALTNGLSEKSTDCNDNNKAIYPGAIELCNDIDDNCNGAADEGVQKPTFYKDNDGDNFGGTTSKIACTPPDGFVAESGDCNDFNKNIYPGAPELCDDIDNDCNGANDDGLPLVDVFTDLDGDGHGGKNALGKKHCLLNGTDAPFGYAVSNDDCDDSKSTVYPGAPELCDGVLNNCSLKVADYQCPTKCAGNWPVAIGGGYGVVAVAQLDGDAEWEVVAEQSGSTFVFEHDGALKWKAAGANYSFPSLGDFDHDGILDVAATTGGKVTLLRGTDGAVISNVSSPAASVYYGASIFDLDGNGWPDVVPTTGGALDALFLGPGGSVVKSLSLLPLPGEPGFNLAPSGLFDLDGDGSAEIFAASGSWGCAGNTPTCKGRFFAYKQDGSLFNDPTWQDPAKPLFQVDSYPNSYGGEGYFPVVADFDGDGKAELFQPMSDKTRVWTLDGVEHPLTGKFGNARIFAPVNADGTLSSGGLNPINQAVIDIDSDGIYELVGGVQGGMGVTQKGKTMDGYPIPIGAAQPTLTDLNRDGALDMLWIGDNNAVNCWTMKGSTYAAGRVLHPGGIASPGAPGVYPTGSYDSYEPNQPSAQLDPTTSTNPAADFRAFLPYGLRDQFQSGGGWRHSLRSAIGTQGDADYYWFANGYTSITLVSDVAQKLRLDLDVFVFVSNGNGGWQYKCEAHTADTTNGNLYFHPIQATGTCPVGIGETKGFLVRVKGHNPDADFGPWPYSLSFMWQ